MTAVRAPRSTLVTSVTGTFVVAALAATQDAPAAVAAIERRLSAEALRPAIIAGELPRADLAVLGEAFALEYERWAGLLARAIAGDR